MSIAAGVPPPKAYVLPDSDPNAFAVGRDPAHASIAVTSGLLQALDRENCRASSATRCRTCGNLDIRAMTLVTALFGAALLLSDVTRRGLYWAAGARETAARAIFGRRRRDHARAVPAVDDVRRARADPRAAARVRGLALARVPADASGADSRAIRSAWRARCARSRRREPTRVITQGSAHLCITDPRGMAVNEKEGEVANCSAPIRPSESASRSSNPWPAWSRETSRRRLGSCRSDTVWGRTASRWSRARTR